MPRPQVYDRDAMLDAAEELAVVGGVKAVTIRAVSERAAERGAEIVSDLVAAYLDRYARPRKRSAAEDERILHKDVLSRWGARKAKDISRRDVVTPGGQRDGHAGWRGRRVSGPALGDARPSFRRARQSAAREPSVPPRPRAGVAAGRHGVRNREQHDQVERVELRQFPLAGEPEADDEEHVNQHRPKDLLGDRDAQEEEIMKEP